MPKRKCRLFLVNAFTRELFCGNPAVVVLDAEVLTEEEMRRIAREVAVQDVAFVLAADSSDYDIEVRFFSPRREVTFIGHATVAAHYVRAIADGVPKGKVRQKSGTAVVEVEVSGRGQALHVSILQGPANFGPIIAEDRRSLVLDALGISSASLHPACPMQVMSKANSRLLIGLQTPEALESIQPDMEALTHLSPHVGADGFFVFGMTPGSDPPTTEARMFCPLIGVPEDPVSGNAHGMLGVYLLHHGLLAAEGGKARFVGHQGRFVDRPGSVQVEVTAEAGKRATGVRVTGDAVIVYQAELSL
ncbi:MAG TPA: PhzF family phenazine biosynthesis isomerase [Steroidobacteraceae bacterium]|nr:PhzF family phenazine biosynthesis isomerase [Steroidobacteraceae bacterium]